jgi:hypothetical protein
MRNYVGDAETITIVSAGLNKDEIELFNKLFGSNLIHNSIHYVDLKSAVLDIEGDLHKLEIVDDFSQAYNAAQRAQYVRKEYQALMTRQASNRYQRFQKVAQESHNGLMKYIESKGAYNEDGDLVIPKANFEKWLNKGSKPYSRLKKEEKRQYMFEAEKYLAVLDK